MFNWFKSKPKAPESVELYDWSWITKDELVNYPRGIWEILNRERDGFVVTNFLNQEEVQAILKGYQSLSDEEIVHVKEGMDFYPWSFAQSDQGVQGGHFTLEEYYQSAMDYRATFPQRFGVDMEAKVTHLLESLGPKAHVPPDVDGHGSLMPFTIRDLHAGTGSIKAHCGHFFFNEFPGFYDRTLHFTDTDHQLSFFVMLQKAEKGGELTLFDQCWEHAHKRPDDNTLIRLKDNKALDLNDPKALQRQFIHPEPGSLVIFNGGDIWHRVEDILGSVSRFTIGGFLSLSPDRKDIYFWS